MPFRGGYTGIVLLVLLSPAAAEHTAILVFHGDVDYEVGESIRFCATDITGDYTLTTLLRSQSIAADSEACGAYVIKNPGNHNITWTTSTGTESIQFEATYGAGWDRYTGPVFWGALLILAVATGYLWPALPLLLVFMTQFVPVPGIQVFGVALAVILFIAEWMKNLSREAGEEVDLI